MQKWKCYIPGPEIDQAKAAALAVPTNPYFEIVTNKGLTDIVIMSTESYNAVVAKKIDVFKEGPA